MSKETLTVIGIVKGKRTIGEAWERALKIALDRSNAGYLSPVGGTDFNYNRKNYDVKQNGAVIKYGEHNRFVKGSGRVIYATHIAYEVIREYNGIDKQGKPAVFQDIFVDIGNTDFWIIDRDIFVDHILTCDGLAKENKARNQINIQTLWNYTKGAYHGTKGARFSVWLDDSQIFDDPIKDDILDRFYEKLSL